MDPPVSSCWGGGGEGGRHPVVDAWRNLPCCWLSKGGGVGEGGTLSERGGGDFRLRNVATVE